MDVQQPECKVTHLIPVELRASETRTSFNIYFLSVCARACVCVDVYYRHCEDSLSLWGQTTSPHKANHWFWGWRLGLRSSKSWLERLSGNLMYVYVMSMCVYGWLKCYFIYVEYFYILFVWCSLWFTVKHIEFLFTHKKWLDSTNVKWQNDECTECKVLKVSCIE